MIALDPKLLEILACPKCKHKVVLQGDRVICTNASCGLKFPVRDGIPVMLIEDAEKIQ